MVTFRALTSSKTDEKLLMDTSCVPHDNNMVSAANLGHQTSLGLNSTDNCSNLLNKRKQ